MLSRNISGKNIIIYFPYMLVEIVIIIIGVYLGFQFDDWSEEKKEESIGKQYLSYLLVDLEQDIIHMDNTFIKRYNKKIEGLKLAKSYALSEIEVAPNKEKEFIRKVGYGAVFSSGFPGLYRGTYDELINSGSLRFIKNRGLRKEVSDYYSYVEQTMKLQERIFSGYLTLVNSMRPFDQESPLIINDSDQKIFMNNIKSIDFIRAINLELTSASSVINDVRRIKESANNLRESIKREIKNLE